MNLRWVRLNLCSLSNELAYVSQWLLKRPCDPAHPVKHIAPSTGFE